MAKLKFPWSKKDDPGAKCVYAGPEYYEKRSRMSGVYAGPEAPSGDTQMNDVYAGPEFFEKDPVEPTEQPDPASEEVEEPAETEGSEEAGETGDASPDADPLAPPPFPAPKDMPPEMFMCVYAGPEFFSGPNGQPAGAFAPAPVEAPKSDGPLGEGQIYCPNCGLAINRAKFCSECGAILPQDDTEKE